MANAMSHLGTVTLTTNQATVVFNNLPQEYRDLRIVANYGVTADADVGMQINGDTASSYSSVNMRGNGSAAATSSNSGSSLSFGLQNVTVPTTLTTQSTIEWFDYSAIDKFKPCLIRASDGSAMVIAKAGRWASNSAITSISLYGISASFLAGSTFELFGVKA